MWRADDLGPPQACSTDQHSRGSIVTTTTEEEVGLISTRSKRQVGDVVFARIAFVAGLAIMVALAGVFIFLAIEGVPGFPQDEHFYGHDAPPFRRYPGQIVYGTALAA